MADYPDFYLHVERSPTQPNIYQEFISARSFDRLVAPYNMDYWIYAIPDDGFTYNIDTIYIVTDKTGQMLAAMSYCNDINNPDWYEIAEQVFVMSTEIVLSKLGAFTLKYPQAFFVAFQNLSYTNAYWDVYMVGYRYMLI